MKRFTILFAVLAVLTACTCDSETRKASKLAARVIPGYSSSFCFELLSDTTDVFELESVDGKVVVRGNNANSMAYGLNYYLNNYCNTTLSWHLDDPLYMPEVLPEVPQKVRVPALVKERYFMNYCTYGYSMPWWGWKEWERYIDWMAMHGITMPLSITGEEATLMKVWERFGVPADKIRESFAGPPFLPWNRMMDFDKWMGPLPQKWIDRQEKLQKKILKRERELGMKPVLPAFNGHVPGPLAELYPDANIKEVTKWDGFEAEYGCWFLDPADPLFGEVQKVFLEEQEKLYGTSHIYALDIFNEVHFFDEIDGEEWDPEVLGRLAKHVYETLIAADPDAIWRQEGWMLYHDSKHWGPRQVEAYMDAAPKGRVVMLDYFCDEAEIYAISNHFYGQPYFFCFLGNFGGNTNLSGDFHLLSQKIDRVYAEGAENFLGIGCTLEGFGVSQFLYEYVLDRAWDSKIDDAQWVKTLADRHAGCSNDGIQKAWKALTDEIYAGGATYSGICPVACIHPCFEGHWNWTTLTDVPYTFEQISSVWKDLLANPQDTDFYRFDVVNIGSEVIKLAFNPYRDAFTESYRKGDIEGMIAARETMRSLYADWDRLLACHDVFSLKKWIEAARSWGDTDEEKDYYENCARLIITTWGGTGQLTDYANRQWCGMVSSYYQGRWEMFWDEAISSTMENRPFDEEGLNVAIRKFELSWGVPSEVVLTYPEAGDAYTVAKEIAEKLF